MVVSELLAGLATKLAGLGMAAKAGTGLAVAVTGVTTAGAAGVLPDAAQHAVASVVASATPFTFPDSANAASTVGANLSADATGTSDGTKGINGKSVAEGNPGVRVGANEGATGLDRANQTPAAGRVPTSVPKPAVSVPAPGAAASGGLGTAASTPAADRVPISVPPAVVPPAGAGTASGTPAAARIPASPGRP